MSEIQLRIISLLDIKKKDTGWGFFEKFAMQTDIASQSWRGVHANRQKATLEMLDAIGKIYPEYAFWLVSGFTDSVNGHISPSGEIVDIKRKNITVTVMDVG